MLHLNKALTIIFTLMLGACASAPEQPKPRTFDCGIQMVKLTPQDGMLNLTMRDQNSLLSPVKAASGARYESADARTVVWNKGHEATITWQGEHLPHCVERGYLPKDIAFSGNEPFWALTLNQVHASYTTPRIEQEYAIERQQPSDDHWVVLLKSADAPAGELQINSAVCYDTMSGKAFPYSAQLTIAGETQQGCGGETTQLLQGKPWKMTHMTGFMGSMLEKPSIQFLPDGKLAGSDGCNRFFGNYSVQGEVPRLNIKGSTKRMCAESMMKLAQKFIVNLNNTVKIDIKETQIVLKVDNGNQMTFSSTH